MEQFDQPALDDLAARVLDTGMAPAIAVALTDHERTTLTPTFGAASPDALWPIASIGKSFTAVIALQLVEEGLLDLHAPVTDYVPWLSVGSRFAPITLHHLLMHTAGVIANSDLAPAGMCRSMTTAPGSATTVWCPARGSSPPKPTAACAAPRKIWPATCGLYGPEASCCPIPASPL